MSKAELNINGGALKTGLLKPVIRVDVVSDVVCPWCYIGKRRLEKAIAEVSDKYTFEVFYHPFELNPATPESGVNQREHLAEKFGGDERYQSITNHTSSVALQEGLVMNFEKQSVLANTRKAHALIFAAGNTDRQLAVTEAFFKAYFTDGIDLSKDENLVNIAVEAGLDQGVAETAIGSQSLLDSIVTQEREMQKLGIRGVPFYILNNEYGISGAQASETFIKVFEELKKSPAPEGDACSVDGNC